MGGVKERRKVSHSGSTFDSFLREERIHEDVRATALGRVQAWQSGEDRRVAAELLTSDRQQGPLDAEWHEIFRERMRRFGRHREAIADEAPVSIKIRVTSGCFHREHSPQAYAIIDQSLKIAAGSGSSFEFEEHESGPEILVYAALTTAGLSLAASVINLITASIKARSEGIRKGDRPSDPLELIVRRVRRAGEFLEERVLRVGHNTPPGETETKRKLAGALQELLKEESAPETASEHQRKSGERQRKPKKSSRRKRKK